ncbi:zinc finger MYM-type protein 1-like, partial [Aphis craccivora]
MVIIKKKMEVVTSNYSAVASNLVTNSIASCSQMNIVDESINLSSVCSDDQSNCIPTDDVEGSNQPNMLHILTDIGNIVEQDLMHFQQFPNDPSIILNSRMSTEQFAYVASLQPCQPKASELKGGIFPSKMQGKWLRSFHEEHYYKKLPSGEFIKRNWISYSPSQDKVYCIVCKQFGKEDAKSFQLARFGSDDWNHISFKLKSHESNSVHLESEIRRAMFVNTTTDVSNIEQLSLVIRFINENEEVEERLIALESVADARGIGMFNVVCNICQKYDIDWENQLCAQSYDGASSMQGQYSGVRAYIQEKNPRAIYVWCFSHILNLVVVDTCDTSKTMRNFFGDLQSLIAFLRARKRTAIFLNNQKICYPEERVCRMKNFSSTRWTSHGRALTVILDKYKAVMNTLEELSNSTERETSSMASNLMSTISSFKFVTHLLLMRNIFEHTTPLSMYLQSLSLDFITALTMIDNCANKLSELRNELHLDALLAEAKRFSLENELEEIWFPEKRVQRRKRMAGENTNDEIVSNPKDDFKIHVYYTVLDQISTSITTRFEGSREILSDLTLLSVDRLIATSKGCPIPEDSFVYLDKWIPNLQIDQLKLEYSTFADNFLKFKSNIVIEKLHDKVIISESEADTSADSDQGNNEVTETKMT